jgi:serine/threonine protein phosphatase PrpC
MIKRWHGKDNMFFNEIHVESNEGIVIGNYGGYKNQPMNEDGYYIIKGSNHTFAMLLDAHTTMSSATMMIDFMSQIEEELEEVLSKPVGAAFAACEQLVLGHLQSNAFTQLSQSIVGETAVLFVLQIDNYLWWLSVGDNSLYVFHPEFAELGQYRLNQRVFYQWVGQKNAMNLQVPCYQRGTLELRKGLNTILLLTDGVLEAGSRQFESSNLLMKVLLSEGLEKGCKSILNTIKAEKGSDNATLITWQVDNAHEGLRPSRLNVL